MNIDPRTPISLEVEKTFAEMLPRTALGVALASFDVSLGMLPLPVLPPLLMLPRLASSPVMTVAAWVMTVTE